LTDERCVLKLNTKEKVTVEDINTGKIMFAPTYIVSKVDGDIVKEIVIDSFSLLKK
jgi:hypothetical protein